MLFGICFICGFRLRIVLGLRLRIGRRLARGRSGRCRLFTSPFKGRIFRFLFGLFFYPVIARRIAVFAAWAFCPFDAEFASVLGIVNTPARQIFIFLVIDIGKAVNALVDPSDCIASFNIGAAFRNDIGKHFVLRGFGAVVNAGGDIRFAPGRGIPLPLLHVRLLLNNDLILFIHLKIGQFIQDFLFFLRVLPIFVLGRGLVFRSFVFSHFLATPNSRDGPLRTPN